MAVRRRVSDPEIRKKEILNAALKLAIRVGYQNITRDKVALLVKASPSLITSYFSSMKKLKVIILKYAISNEILSIVAQGVSVGQIKMKNIPHLKNKILTYLSDNR